MDALNSAVPVEPGSADGSSRLAAFPCGHTRSGRNSLAFKSAGSMNGKATRCRQCHNAYQLTHKRAGAGALRLVMRMHAEGALSEGQVVAATRLDRVEVRRLANKAAAA